MPDNTIIDDIPDTKLWVVVPAAGSGSRMQQAIPKQYMNVNGMTIIEHTMNLLLAKQEVEKLVVCIASDDLRFGSLPLARNPRVTTTVGGDSRAQSVLNGLTALSADDCDWVLVHDAARPCLDPMLLDSMVHQLWNDEVGGILAVPANDTLKRANGEQRIEETVDRSTIWQAQTPQMFRYGLLKSALVHALNNNLEITDEASAIELCAYQPKLLKGDARNIKVTTRQDIGMAEFLLSTEDLAANLGANKVITDNV